MITISAAQTKKYAIRLAKKILRANRPERSRGATVIALFGDLGSGKTTFTQGFLKALGVRERAKSPTFVLMHHHTLIVDKGHETWDMGHFYTDVYHIDLYRLKNAREARHLELKKILKNPRAILVIEWPEIIASALPKNAIHITFRHEKKENQRSIHTR
ncbi:MAG: tRNA (adenosine(37)-N6)-threonylcarbamoyltransferase complex ATPase subunit type 1 TsaE [bacterium]|nr:tRNA (adenosine(37)-N6)-threonylcarbamoyltransferase complex ATPase subunit type 1 TsaE [bacterium]